MARSLVVMLSNSGASEEIIRLVPSLRARDCTSVAITGCDASPLALSADHSILAAIEREAGPIGMAPTSSTTLQLAIGDGLAVAASQMRGFTRDEFLRHHPAGLLGRQIIPVASVMRQGDDLPKVQADTPLLELLAVMSAKRMGAACVVDANNHLLGLVVDGDVRRHLQRGESVAEAKAGDLMQENPRVLNARATLGDAVAQRKGTTNAWLVMPVTDNAGRLKGMLHAQDVFG
jgi:arabinose-5-phosphate isomerase